MEDQRHEGRILGCLSAALLGAAIALPNPVMAFRSGGGFEGMRGGFGGDGMHFGGAASVGATVTSLPGKDMAMRSSNKRFMIVKFEDGSVAVVQTDPSTPRLLEVVARFSDASHARNYADAENNRADKRPTIAAAADSVACTAGISRAQV
jgi:hypothetical protein